MASETASFRVFCTLSGAAAAGVWALQQPLDKRALGHGYDDVELLGRLIRPSGDGWYPAGLLAHCANGAMFGLAYSELRLRTPNIDPLVTATGAALAEHVGLFPLGKLVDDHHPARDQLATTWNLRAFAQATWRHLLFGALLGLLVRAAPRGGTSRR